MNPIDSPGKPEPPVILDHVDNLELSSADVAMSGNEIRTLNYLAEGLRFLDGQVTRVEQEVRLRLDPKKRVTMVGNAPALKGIPQGLVACGFHWYAVSVCNYVRLVGWLACERSGERATAYLKRVVPAVYLWRNKVAAHFAITDPKNDDNPADLAKSVMFPLSFEDDAFYAGALNLVQTRNAETSASRQDMRWSLTHTHRDLCARYWPPSGLTGQQ